MSGLTLEQQIERERRLLVEYDRVKRAEPKWCPHVPTERQKIFLASSEPEVFYGGSAGGGKALHVDTPIPTPSGWATIGELAVGDLVFADDGSICAVLAESEVMYDRPCYRVSFSDGSALVADAEHGWVTLTDVERAAIKRRTEGARVFRRAKRQSRASGRGLRPHVGAANSRREHVYLAPPGGSVRTTAEVAATLRRGKRLNHSVGVGGALRCFGSALPIDAYTLGAWLGDGTSASVGITSADAEIPAEIAAAGYKVVKSPVMRYYYGVQGGLYRQLREEGLLGDKHIPAQYLRADVSQRLALLQGLMDTDGDCDKRGQCTFNSSNRALAEQVLELILSLGIKAVLREGVAKLKGRIIGPSYRIKFSSSLPVFRLPRKLRRQKLEGFRPTVTRRYITDCEPVESVPVKCITVSSGSHCYLAGRSMIPTHNSDALLAAALQYAHVPGYAAILFRRTLTDLALPESLIPRSHEWLRGTPARWHEKESLGIPGRTWVFPSGATLTFGYLDSENDKYRYQSSAYSYVGFDELTQFTESMYLYLFSRLRRGAASEVPLRMRSASNPGGEGHEWVKARFIPEDYTKDQATEARAWRKRVVDEEGREVETVFVPSRVTDNPHLDQVTYVEGLKKLDRVTREQLLYGDWSISPTGRSYFNPKALEMFRQVAGQVGELVVVENVLGEKRIVFQQREDGMLAVWRTPRQGKRYVMGCDTALGKDANKGEGKVDADWSVIQVREQETGEQVARFRGRVSEAYFGEYWVRLHRWFNNAYVVPAVTGGYGRAALVSAMSCGLDARFIYCREDETGLPGKRPSGAVDLGFTETTVTRPVLYSNLDVAISQHAIETYDAVTINEYYAFEINKDGKPEARTGTKDDCVTADALCVKGLQVAPRVVKLPTNVVPMVRKYNQVKSKMDQAEEAFWRMAQIRGGR